MHLTIAFVLFVTRCRADLLEECAKLLRPQGHPGHQHLPYVGDVAMPVNVRPTPVSRTRAVKVTTEYVYKNPVCVKYAKGKRTCKREDAGKGAEKLVTREYFVEGVRRSDEEEDEGSEPLLLLQSSETPGPPTRGARTPILSDRHVQDLLIEDRLDQLETILPHYTRRRLYETMTVTVTKVLSNRRSMATLLARNCVPHGFDVCTAKKKRKSKVAKTARRDDEGYYFGR